MDPPHSFVGKNMWFGPGTEKNVLRLDHERYHSTNGDQGRARKELDRFDCDYGEGNEKYNLRR